jgi:ATP-dependent DNA helicase RecG
MNPGIQGRALSILLSNRPLKTIERQIKQLILKQLIERRGSRKTGGYWYKNDLG